MAFEQFTVEVDETVDQIDLLCGAVPEEIDFPILLDMIPSHDQAYESGIGTSAPDIHFLPIATARIRQMSIVNRVDDGRMCGMHGSAGPIDHDGSSIEKTFPSIPVESVPGVIDAIRNRAKLMPCEGVISRLG